MSREVLPPGPRPRLPGALVLAVNRDLVGTFRDIARRYGDVAGFRVGPFPVALLAHPDQVHEALVVRHRELVRGDTLRYLRTILGTGLLTSDGAEHLRRRRILAPVFARAWVPAWGAAAAACAQRVTAGWRDGEVRDVEAEMNRLSLLVVGRTLLDVDLEGEAREVGAALPVVLSTANRVINPFAPVLDRLPLPATLRFRAARATLDRLVLDLIARRRADGRDHGDLLSLVLAARDREDGRGLTDSQIRDELMTLLLAGHETVAAALSWTWYLLARHPDIEARLHAEVDAARAGLAGSGPDDDKTAGLGFTRLVLTEAMRLFPPVPAINRQTLEPYPVAAEVLPARCVVVLSPAVTQRDPRFFPDPDRFDPDRWSPHFRTGLPRGAYSPFGAGPHQCIGESLAWTECLRAVASIAAGWRLRLPDGAQVGQRVRVTLRPASGLPMRLERRAPARPH